MKEKENEKEKEEEEEEKEVKEKKEKKEEEEREEEKGRIILVNALAALTSATSRCTRPGPDSFDAPRTYRSRVGARSCTAPFRMTRRRYINAIGISLRA